MVNGETRTAGEVCQLQKRCRAQLGDPSAQPGSRLLPKMAPRPCPSPGHQDQKEEMKEQEEEEGEVSPRWVAAVPSVWGRGRAGVAAARREALPRGAWGRTPGRQGMGEHGSLPGRPVHASLGE